jgi:low temperature requirement protein LtrA
MSVTAQRPARHLVREEAEPRVSPLELFFDLVFVFAITQVTAFMAADPTFAGLGRGLLILALVWWSWSGYAWLTNAVDPDEGRARVVMFFAMGAMLVLALAVPGAFAGDGVLFGAAYCAIRVVHAALFWVAAAGDDPWRRNVTSLVITALVGPGIIIAASAALDGTAQDVAWVVAVVLDYGIVLSRPPEGWHVHPGHFAERFGLIVIIALGESIVALGVGAAELKLDAALVVAAALTIGIVAMLWWAYFDVVAIVAEQRFRAADPLQQPRIARDAYAIIHLPMIAGIVLFALGVKKGTEHLGDPLKDVAAVALCGGLALYALAHVAFRLRNVRTLSKQRTVTAVVCLALIPVALEAPALLTIGVLTAVWIGLITYEAVRFAERRREVRAASHSGG